MPCAGLISGADPRSGEILRFWFGADLARVPKVVQRRWFAKSPAFDAEIRTRFAAVYQGAVRGEVEDWRQGPHRCLAYVVLLDQFPRNMFRGTAQAFASDSLALAAARGAIVAGFDREVPPLARAFFYLPFEHSEDLADQDECVRLVEQWQEPELAPFADFARRHRAIVARFGRFPHRNAVLGRKSTAAEMEFLREPGSSF